MAETKNHQLPGGEAAIEQKMAIVKPNIAEDSTKFEQHSMWRLIIGLLDDASRWTIARAEVHSGACLLAAARSYHTNMSNELQSQDVPSAPRIEKGISMSERQSGGGGSGMAVCIHSMSQDATTVEFGRRENFVH